MWWGDPHSVEPLMTHIHHCFPRLLESPSQFNVFRNSQRISQLDCQCAAPHLLRPLLLTTAHLLHFAAERRSSVFSVGLCQGGKTRFVCVLCSVLQETNLKHGLFLRNVFLTCRWRFGVDGRCGGDEGGEEERSKWSFGVEGGALRGQILTAAHAAVDLKVQGFGFLLEGSANKRTRNEKKKNTFHQQFNYDKLSK